MLIFEKSRAGRRAYRLLPPEVPRYELKATGERTLHLPELGEADVVRHYTHLSERVYGLDHGFYPLGSCTMKYNPKVNERIAAWPDFTDIHPLQTPETCQGCLRVLDEAKSLLLLLTGMDELSFQPAAGAQGEFASLLTIKAWHAARQETERSEVLIPDSAHGTNPASAHMAGYKVIEVRSDDRGLVDLSDLRAKASRRTAALMLTNPNTLGRFERDVLEMAAMVHEAGGLLYYDGANMNAVMGRIRPGDMGFDAMHINLHKTFSTPHGGGGPGCGAIAVKSFLRDFLPGPLVAGNPDTGLYWFDPPRSIGRMTMFNGHFLVVLRALAYLKSLGREGIPLSSGQAVLNANYLKSKLADIFETAPGFCMHEFVVSCAKIKAETGVSALDIAKCLIDYDFHPPTMYFPLVVKEALMFEPTETENRDTLDAFAAALHQIVAMAYQDPARCHEAPQKARIARVDEAAAARHPCLRYDFAGMEKS